MTMIMSKAVFCGKMGESNVLSSLKNTLSTTEKNWKLGTAI